MSLQAGFGFVPWTRLTPLDAADRAVSPLVRDSHGKLVPVDWATALGTFAERFKAVQAAHGLDLLI